MNNIALHCNFFPEFGGCQIIYNVLVEFDEPSSSCFIISFYDFYIPPVISVRGPSKRSTIVGRYLVRRFTGFPPEKYGRTDDRGRQTRRNVRYVRFDVHVESRIENGSADEETVYKIRLSLVFVRVLFEYV